MKCVNHPETESVAFCAQCGRALCGACKHDVKGATYCEECLAAHLHAFNPLAHSLSGGASPGIAMALGFIPGVGAIYNGQVIKGMIQVLLFGTLIAMSNRVGGPYDVIFGWGAAAFYFYMVIDSFQTAKAKMLGRPTPEWFGLGDVKMNAPIGAALLIGLGILILLDNFGIPVFRELMKFWPVLLIVIGILLLQRRMGGGSHPSGGQAPGSQPPGPSQQGPGNFPGPQGM
jgi:TM2 domain-containing membrane protein YozV